MTQLIRKDLRLYRPVMLGAILFTVGVYAIGAVPILYRSGSTNTERIRQFLSVALLATATTGAFAAALGGSSFAVERRDESAEFMSMLPVTRTRILASKAVVALTFVSLTFAAHAVVVLLALRHVAWRAAVENLYALAGIGTGTLMLFAIAWLLSAFLSNAAIAAGVSFGATVASAAILSSLIEAVGKQGYAFIHLWLAFSGSLAIACALTGSLLYLRRVSP